MVLATSASSNSPAGVYSITASGASSPDYAISYRAGTLTVSPQAINATVTGRDDVALTGSETATVYGQTVVFTATVKTATGTPSGTVAFYDGTTLLATVPLNGSGTALLTTTALAAGSHAITAIYNGDTDFAGSQSGVSSVTVAQTSTKVVMIQNPVLKKKKLTSVGLIAEIVPSTAGGGVPTGEVTFELRTKVKKKVKTTTLGRVALSGGEATLTLKASKVKGKGITVVYSGDANDTASSLTAGKIR